MQVSRLVLEKRILKPPPPAAMTASRSRRCSPPRTAGSLYWSGLRSTSVRARCLGLAARVALFSICVRLPRSYCRFTSLPMRSVRTRDQRFRHAISLRFHAEVSRPRYETDQRYHQRSTPAAPPQQVTRNSETAEVSTNFMHLRSFESLILDSGLFNPRQRRASPRSYIQNVFVVTNSQ